MRNALVHTDIDTAEGALVLGLARGLPGLGVERIVLVQVVDASGMEGPVIAARVDRVREQLREAAGPLREAGLEVELRVPTGDAERELLALSAQTDVDAIVSGSHGKSTMGRLFAGSVSEALAAQAGVPNVVVRFELVRDAAEPVELTSGFCRRIVLPTDLSPAADRAFELALGLPTTCHERLVLVHVAEEGSDTAVAEEELHRRCGRAGAIGVDATYVIRHGDVVETVLAEAASHEATGIVLGTRGGGSAWGELVVGSLALALLRSAPCPVIIVP